MTTATPTAPSTASPDNSGVRTPPSTGSIIRATLLVAGAIVMLIPVVWAVLSSFKDTSELAQRPPTILPQDPTFSNYTEALTSFSFLTYFKNSVVVTVAATALTLLINSMAAFALAKYNFRGRNALFLLTLATIMIPLQVILIPVYQVVANLGLVNSLWGLIIPPAATPTGVFLLRQYMLTIPDDLIEAARIDGASEWRIFWRIIMPLCRPALAVVAIFSIIWRWNDFLWPLIVAQDESVYTLPVALARFNGQQVVPFNLVLAMSVLTILPVVIIFLVLQRHILTGIAQTGLK
ncbi:carbohydrate ABC transporter membrane protein 2 (CUT1 family) [Knoellia remsis]|uniref:Carbohydrate ABC transporter membrane protein 2 (CUT1 family) n=1 Tax=Knoellia remsis TaxID=407159 RepID=A0A2T0UJY1_9MICO|nr:carbohydrate ABC transporter permease [Knoellia remsis]PRY58245.1 carbohydrate ABC transporter membrane protein 2 (CUT1 family) [Knoellia remsis]